jgi:hypothetical protein
LFESIVIVISVHRVIGVGSGFYGGRRKKSLSFYGADFILFGVFLWSHSIYPGLVLLPLRVPETTGE